MKNRFLVGLLVMLVLTYQSYSQALSESAPQSITAQIDKIFNKWDKPDSPGCALAVMRDGRVIYKKGYGMADLDHDIPISPRSIFHIASLSKQFTAASIALLLLQNKLSLDDPVRKYFPELPDFGETITIRHLIHHTSGLRDQWTLLGLAGWRYSLDLITDDDVIEVISQQKELNFRPGDKFLYCNTGYTLMAMIVARVSRQSFREFTNANIFRPLGMKSTHFRDDHAEIVKNQAYGYIPAGDTFRLSVTNFDTVGATSLLTTVEDLALWDQNFYDRQVGGNALVEQLLQPGKLNDGETLNYAFGLIHGKYRGKAIVEHGGSDAGYRSHLIRFPGEHFSVSCLCNAGPVDTAALTRQVADIVLATQFKETEPSQLMTNAPPVSGALPQNRTGMYLNLESGTYLSLSLENNQFSIMFSGQNYKLTPIGGNSFQFIGRSGEAHFAYSNEPARSQIIVQDGMGISTPYDYVSPFTLSVDKMPEYIGTYVSDEIEPLYRVYVQGEKLFLDRTKNRAIPLQPIMPDLFISNLGVIQFSRNAQSQIIGFIYNLGRVRNFKFKKK